MDNSEQSILVISAFRIWPPHFGASERTYNLAKQLAAKGELHLTVLHSSCAQVQGPVQVESWPNTEIITVGPARRWAQAFNPRMVWKGLVSIRRKHSTVILCGHLWSTAVGMLLSWFTGIPFILDAHNVEHIRFQRMGKKPVALVRLWERLACKRAAAITCVSAADRRHFVEMGVPESKITVVANAIDTKQYRPNPEARAEVRQALDLAERQPMLLFFGKLDYGPNAEALHIIADELLPRIERERPDAQIVVCGYHPRQDLGITHPQFRYMGFVPRIEDYINAADCVLVPLLSGGGTKFKIIQALSCLKPVVTTTVGAEGFDPIPGWLNIADTWDEFSQVALRCVTAGAELPQEPVMAFREAYSWQNAAARMHQVIRATTQDHRRSHHV